MIGDSPLARAFWEHGRCDDCPVYDMHGHMGPFYAIYFPRPDAADMVGTMDEAGVRMLVFSHHAALFSPELGNQPSIDAVRQFPDRLRAYLAINPNYPERVAADLAAFDRHRDVFVGLKFLASYHGISMTDVRNRAAWEFADERSLLVLAHTWEGADYCGPAQVREIAQRYPHLKLLMGHSLHTNWDAAVRMVRDFPNTYAELTAVLDDYGAIEKLVDQAGSDRMLFGTDLPWFDPHHGIGCLLSADITDEDRHNILHRNAETLLAPFLSQGA